MTSTTGTSGAGPENHSVTTSEPKHDENKLVKTARAPTGAARSNFGHATNRG